MAIPKVGVSLSNLTLDAYDGLSNELDMLDKISCAPPIVQHVTTSSKILYFIISLLSYWPLSVLYIEVGLNISLFSGESEPPPAKIAPVKKAKKKLKAPPKKSLMDINLTSSDEDTGFNVRYPEQLV